MTHRRPLADSEGDFGVWQDHPTPCARFKPSCTTCQTPTRDPEQEHPGVCVCGGYITDVTPCGAKVLVRTWESSDGAYEDLQFRCEAGHVWWVESADA